MSYFVTITFDLEYAAITPHGTNVYSKIAKHLDELDYTKYVKGKRKRRRLKLPANTYIAEFDSDVDDKSGIVNFVRDELKHAFKIHGVSGKYFISVGENWKWKVGSVGGSPL
jgi:hypothetical protein